MGGERGPEEEALVPGLRFSRLEFATPHQDEDGNLFLDVPDPIARRPSRRDKRVPVGTGDDLHKVAARAFRAMLDPEQDVGPSRFFWVIAQLNDVVDVTLPLAEGDRLRVVSIQTLTGEILVRPAFSRRSTVT